MQIAIGVDWNAGIGRNCRSSLALCHASNSSLVNAMTTSQHRDYPCRVNLWQNRDRVSAMGGKRTATSSIDEMSRNEAFSSAEGCQNMGQTAFTIAAVPLIAAFLLGGCTAVPPTAPSAAPVTVQDALCTLGYSSIPLRSLPTGHHITAVSLNGQPATFFVDTGAGRTVIDRPYADKLGLHAAPGQQVIAIGPGGSAAAAAVEVSEFAIQGTRTSLTRLFAMDLSQMVNALSALVGKPVAGIVGQDILQAQHAIIDVEQSRLYLRPVGGQSQTGC